MRINFDKLRIGMKDIISKTITETDVVLDLGITLDTNPIRFNEKHSKILFKKRG